MLQCFSNPLDYQPLLHMTHTVSRDLQACHVILWWILVLNLTMIRSVCLVSDISYNFRSFNRNECRYFKISFFTTSYLCNFTQFTVTFMYKELYEGTWPVISYGFVSSIRADFMYVRFQEMRTLMHIVLYCTPVFPCHSFHLCLLVIFTAPVRYRSLPDIVWCYLTGPYLAGFNSGTIFC